MKNSTDNSTNNPTDNPTDNSTDNLNSTDGININIQNLINELKNIGHEKEKEEFIKNYSKIKEQIKMVDSILFDDTKNDIYCETINTDENNEFKTKNINELLTILELNEDKIFNSTNLTVGELKSLMSICNLLENKINEETINIVEIE